NTLDRRAVHRSGIPKRRKAAGGRLKRAEVSGIVCARLMTMRRWSVRNCVCGAGGRLGVMGESIAVENREMIHRGGQSLKVLRSQPFIANFDVRPSSIAGLNCVFHANS